MNTHKFVLMLILTAEMLTCTALRGNYSPINSFPPIKVRACSIVSPCFVSQNGTLINIDFTTNLGSITVSIKDESGDLVYETNTTATSGSSFTIDTTGWGSGNYTLTVTNSSDVIYTTVIDIL
jgi:hypothetical protein